TAGRSSPIRMAIIAMTTSSSIRVKPDRRGRESRRMKTSPLGWRVDWLATLLLGAGEFFQPDFIDEIHFGTDEHDQTLAVLAGLFVRDHLRRVTADATDRSAVGDDERLLVAFGEERRVELCGVQPVGLELEIGHTANVLLEGLLVRRP